MMTGTNMGRILLDLSDDVIKRLEQYLERQADTTISNALGIWQGCEEDGVEFERKLREEWQ